MKKLLLAAAAIALMTAPAVAQTKGPETYTLTMTPQEVNAVGVALMQRPYNEVADLMSKLNDQIKKQNDAAPTAPPTPAPRPPDAPKK